MHSLGPPVGAQAITDVDEDVPNINMVDRQAIDGCAVNVLDPRQRLQ